MRCKCDGILKVVAQALHWIRYECRRCKTQYEWRELSPRESTDLAVEKLLDGGN
jgi:hypothetical protein